MPELFTFFIILFAGLIFSEVFNRLHLPYVTALIVAGVLVGPEVLGLIEVDAVVRFLASVGVVFLMFIAGSEIKTSHFEKVGKAAVIMALINGAVPFGVGYLIGWWFGYSTVTSLVLGTIFVSSSVAVIVPTLEASGLIRTKFGETVLTAVIIQDVASLLLLSFFLQRTADRGVGVAMLVVAVVIGILMVLRKLIPKLRDLALFGKRGDDLFETELRFVFVVLLASVVMFELLGIDPLVAGFLIGMILGDFIRGRVAHKIHTVGYGLFIPAFFLVIGMGMNIGLFGSSNLLLLSAVVVVGSVMAKMVSGVVGAKLVGFKSRDQWLTGVASTPQLSTTLAASFVAVEFGLLPEELVAALIVLVLVTTFVAPIVMRSANLSIDKGVSHA